VAFYAIGFAFQRSAEAGYFWLEMALFVIVPVTLLSFESVRNNLEKLYWSCAFVVGGFMVNRLDVSINSLQTAMGSHYVPKWSELASTVLVIAAAVVAFRYAVMYLDILPKAPSKPAWRWMANAGQPAEA
jgi:Ni/Fe-hydrogenase subunit HybB-like protein